jgi:hypothetical protein
LLLERCPPQKSNVSEMVLYVLPIFQNPFCHARIWFMRKGGIMLWLVGLTTVILNKLNA